MTTSDTATPRGAMEHARAKAQREAAAVRAKPTVPVTDACDLPVGVDLQDLCWDECLDAGGYSARVLERGTTMRLDDLEGDACVSLLAYNADCLSERLNVADTVKVQWQAYLGLGDLLLSDMGRVLLSIRADTSTRHDALCGASSPWSNAARYGTGDNHGPCPSARDRFVLALAKHGLGKRDICPNVNLFKQVRVGGDGSLTFVQAEPVRSHVELRAEMRVLVVIANTPHVLDPRTTYDVGPVRVLAWRGHPTRQDDPLRASTPERLRAFQNVEDYYA
ncbi:MAG TPA: urea amidolyase associated protein UAAP1 [Candidatus Limnocylindrales bacterium]|nr:urea amidolyase associated protein UAAP1 [Candidatus Limnocylindrales bacterium]